MDCLDANSVLDLAAGALSGARGAAAERHIDVCPRCRKLVVEAARLRSTLPAPAPDEANSAAGGAAGDSLQRGCRIGNFVVREELGRGGMGRVFLAEHPEIGRRVAVKVLEPRFSLDAEVSRRFLAEARILAQLRHPHIVEVYDFGRLDDGRLYYVMQLLAGRDLGVLVDERGRLPVPEALDLAVQICRGLQACHEAGIIHRDLKPKNVVVGKADGRVTLVDFGLARTLGRSPADASRLGAILGTPVCMAPEQAAGEPDRIGPRTDLYALGVVLYWMLRGRPPFVASTPGRLMAMHLDADAPPLDDALPDLPAPLTRIVGQCLAKNPEDRPASAKVVIEALEAARGVPAGTRTPRRRWLVLSLILAVVVSTAALALRATLAPRQSSSVARPRASGATAAPATGRSAPASSPPVAARPPPRRSGDAAPLQQPWKPRARVVTAPSPATAPSPRPPATRPRAIGEGTMPF